MMTFLKLFLYTVDIKNMSLKICIHTQIHVKSCVFNICSLFTLLNSTNLSPRQTKAAILELFIYLFLFIYYASST